MWFWILLGTALADVDTDDRWVGHDTLAFGINEDGSLINEDISLGILWGAGAEDGVPMGGDMIRIGYKWDVWSWSYTEGGSSRTYRNYAPHEDSDLELTWTERVETGGLVGLKGEASTGDLSIDLTVLTRSDMDAAIFDITYTATEDLEDLVVARTVDPDQDYWATEAYGTINESGDGYGTAVGSFDDRAIALVGAAADGTLGVGGVCEWCTTPAGVIASAGQSSTDDDQPGVAVSVGTLAAGESTRVRFVYAVGLGADTALEVAWDALALEDMDGDGVTSEDGDCDDWDLKVYEGAFELADGIDNDCDGEIDEDAVTTDDDGDGYSELDGDCDDTDPSVFPGADAVEGVTNADCDGLADTGGAFWADTGEPDAPDTGQPDTGSADTGSPTDPGPGDPGDTGDTSDDTSDDTGANSPGGDTGGSGDMGNTDTAGASGDDADGDEDKSGCGCASAQGTWGGWLFALMLVAARRSDQRERCT